ncbi:inositol 1,4,5-triphosphate receptor associated 2 [Gracilinanus agilis]|uniref:inositol 1,4,5-triphosphate receptor associated 2 n=1 Tax=Gracilinanus agilis TaxID=191870 RepID=UPI001CFD06C2|nr:inositol 1,4,5-triphosphate receptor associated 2 [Gracilinanus agilis]
MRGGDENDSERLSCHKKFNVHETRIYETPLNLEFTSWYTPLLDALHLDSLIKTSRLNKENLSCISNRGLFSCERSEYGEVKDEPSLDVTLKGNKCLVVSVAVQTIAHLPVSTTMDDLCVKENLVHQLPPEGLLQDSEYSTPAPGHTSSMNSTVTSGSSPGFLTMASDNVDPKSHYEKDETTQPAPIMIEPEGKSLANENTPCHSTMDEKKTTLNLETKGPEATKDCKEEPTVGGETAASTSPVTSVKSVNFKQNDHSISTNEKEVEAEFLRLSLGFKCDWFTLEKRVKLEERSRDLAEENLKKEITNCLKLLKSLIPLCDDDNQAQEIIKKLEKNLKFLNQCTTRVASKAEMLGAINQESRVSKAVEVMIQHVENLKRMYAKEHAELEELKQVLLQNERPFSTLDEDEDKEESEPPTEEVLEKTRKLSLSEKKKNQCRWDISSLYDIGATWASDLKTSFRKTNITLWISIVFIVLFAAFMSFLTGRFFQRPVDAAPVKNGGSWTSLQQALWPYTKLQHNGPPPV